MQGTDLGMDASCFQGAVKYTQSPHWHPPLLQLFYPARCSLQECLHTGLCSSSCFPPQMLPPTGGKEHLWRPSRCPPITSRGSLNVIEETFQSRSDLSHSSHCWLPPQHHATMNSPLIKFYWNLVMLIHLFMAAFMLQWRNWVIATETACPAKPRRVTIRPLREKKFPNPGLPHAAASCFVQQRHKKPLAGASVWPGLPALYLSALPHTSGGQRSWLFNLARPHL